MALAGLAVADPPDRWRALGFAIGEDGTFGVSGIRVTLGLAPPGEGIVGWTLRGLTRAGPIDGLATAVAPDLPPSPTWPPGAIPAARPMPAHGVIGIDHVVILTPHLDALAVTLQDRGLPLTRRRELRGRRMGFRRLGPTIMEIVEAPQVPATAFWGVTFTVADLGALAGLGSLVGQPREAVQPGRRIATVSPQARLSAHVAFIDPEPARPAAP